MYCANVEIQLKARICAGVRAVVKAKRKIADRISDPPKVPFRPMYLMLIKTPPTRVPGMLHAMMIRLLRYVIAVLLDPVSAPWAASSSGRKFEYRGLARPIMLQIRMIIDMLSASFGVAKSARTWGSHSA